MVLDVLAPDDLGSRKTFGLDLLSSMVEML